jgi:hypothetical protein
MRSRCMSLLPCTTLHSDSEQYLSDIVANNLKSLKITFPLFIYFLIFDKLKTYTLLLFLLFRSPLFSVFTILLPRGLLKSHVGADLNSVIFFPCICMAAVTVEKKTKIITLPLWVCSSHLPPPPVSYL